MRYITLHTLINGSIALLFSAVTYASTTTLSNYDEAGNVGQVEDASGRKIQFTYPTDNQVDSIRVCGMVCGDANDLVTDHQYDAVTRLRNRTTLPDGIRMDYVYDALGFVSQSTTTGQGGSLSLSSTRTNDAYGMPTYQVDSRGVSTAAAYDAMNRPTAVNQALNSPSESLLSTTIYYPEGQIKRAEINPGGAGGRHLTIETTLGAMGTSSGYLATEVLESWTLPDLTAQSLRRTYTYDPLGRVLSETVHSRDPATGTQEAYLTTYSYSDNVTVAGLAACVSGGCQQINTTGPDGQTTIQVVDVKRRPVQRVLPRGETTTWEYDHLGNVIAMVEAAANLTAGDSVLSGQAGALYLRSEYTYDAAGRVLSQRRGADLDANGVLSAAEVQWEETLAYDDFGRLRWRRAGDSTTGMREVYA